MIDPHNGRLVVVRRPTLDDVFLTLTGHTTVATTGADLAGRAAVVRGGR